MTIDPKNAISKRIAAVFETLIDNQARERLATGTVRLACISADGRARRIPDTIFESLKTDADFSVDDNSLSQD